MIYDIAYGVSHSKTAIETKMKRIGHKWQRTPCNINKIGISIMRKLTGFIVLLAVLGSVAYASEDTASLESLLQMRVAASGAIDTVLNLLEDLRKSSQNERNELDKKNQTQEANGIKLIAELTNILSISQTNYDTAVAHRQFLEKEIEESEAHIEWIDNRLEEIKRKLGELKKQRCQANAMFVDALKQHNDALKAIKILQDEIKKLHAAGELTEISSLTEKFKAYEHLFEKESIQQFLDLSKEQAGISHLFHFFLVTMR